MANKRIHKICKVLKTENISVLNEKHKYILDSYFVLEGLDDKTRYYIQTSKLKRSLDIEDENLYLSSIAGAVFLVKFNRKSEKKAIFQSKSDSKVFINLIDRVFPVRKKELVSIEKLNESPLIGRVVFVNSKYIIVSVADASKFIKYFPEDFYINKYENMTLDFRVGDKINLFLAYKDGTAILKPLNIRVLEKEIISRLKIGALYKGIVISSFIERKSNKTLFFVELECGYMLISALAGGAKFPLKRQKVFVRILETENDKIKSEIIN